MTKDSAPALDENSRRYYLEVMGVQCWESINAQAKSETPAAVLSAADSNRDVVGRYSSIEKSVQQCTDCALCKTRKQALPGRGNQSAELMFIVLSPSSSDDESGVICSGEANLLLTKMLCAININIDDVYLSSLLKCSVPVNHTISAGEIQSCHHYLKQQIQFIQPEQIVVLGETAVRCLLQKDLAIDDYRAMNNTSHQLESVPLFVSYSPEELLQQPENKRKAWSDLQQLQKIIQA